MAKHPNDTTPDADNTPAKPTGSNVGRTVLPPSSVDRPQAVAPAVNAEPSRVGGTLTRAGMEAAIANGGAVTFGGRVYSSVADLPTQEQIDTFNQQNAQAQAETAATLNKPK